MTLISSHTVTHCKAAVHTSMTVKTLLSPAAAAFKGGSAYPTLSMTSRDAFRPLYAISPANLAAVGSLIRVPLTVLEMEEVLERLLTVPMEQVLGSFPTVPMDQVLERLPTLTAPKESEVSVTVMVMVDSLE